MNREQQTLPLKGATSRSGHPQESSALSLSGRSQYLDMIRLETLDPSQCWRITWSSCSPRLLLLPNTVIHSPLLSVIHVVPVTVLWDLSCGACQDMLRPGTVREFARVQLLLFPLLTFQA
jgi:hypothetical protein